MSVLSRDRWHVVSPYLDRAMEMEEGERNSWLESLRSEDPNLAEDVEALLHERRALDQENFLEGAALQPPTPASLAGQTIGAYTLISLIGQGGMGNVWLARRSDGRFQGQAAVKLLNASLVGRVGEERFKREGSILGRLTHSHIARLVDAGMSPAGQPYLVLEYVEGEQIDRYCDSKSLGVEARLRLFLDVLAAVAHAHASLIVHRDIKPSNMLVGTDGQVKLLDFGIAKMLEGEWDTGEATALTREGGRALTPEYAAPEQVTGAPITTATDVYALGTLLYVLLSGHHPAEAALKSTADLVKAIVDTQPPQLSDAVIQTKTQTAEKLESDAALRATTPDGLRRILKGDLDTIVAKALKKNAEERYLSVTALADDLQRYLDHEPISARPDTLAYRTTKFVRRNRTPVVLSAVAIVALVAGLVGTITQARRATRQAAVAEAQRGRADQQARAAGEQRDFALRQLSRAEAINELNAFLLSDAAPSGKPFTVGDLLARAERVVEREHGENDENRVEILIALGRQYRTQDQVGNARRLLERAYELAGKLPERSLRAKAACALAGAVAPGGETERAERLFHEGLGNLPNEPQFALDRAFCLLRGSEVAREGGDVIAGVERALAARRLLKDSHLASPLTELGASIDVAEAYRMAGRHNEAAAAFEEAFDRLSSLGRADTERAGTLLNNWGLMLQSLGQPLKAESVFRRAVRISSADRSGRSVSPMLLTNLARTLADLHRLSEAADYAERAYAEAKRAGNEVVINQCLLVRASAYRQRGDLARAASALSEVEPRLRRMLPRGHVAFAALESEQALLAQAQGDLEAASGAADRATAIAAATPQGAEYMPRLLLRRSDLDLRLHRVEQSWSDAAKALDLEQRATAAGSFSSRLGRGYLALGRALQAQGRAGEAQTAFVSALQHLRPSLGEDHPDTRDARRLAGAEVANRE